ncbi:malonyl-CoA decarboxylase, mitochondrial-like isoform X2 [Dermatophagoides pteronyssinus]|uniref:Malonyl-CoA decarboxylase, mitochondrial-like n=2 Tax=Dermatophagoides pteronyssinus TaxID=6956 RepID=A0ABQ8J2D1_DERPT|nr:hypothetical protein DERP_012140 [Dermatophagoides pteronyssinus]
MLFNHHIMASKSIIANHYSIINSLFKCLRLIHFKHHYNNNENIYRKIQNPISSLLSIRSSSSSTTTTTTSSSWDLKFARQNVYDPNSITINGLNSNLEKLQHISTLIVQLSTVRDITQKQSELALELCNVYYDSNPLERFRYLCFLSDELSTTIDVASQASSSFLQTQTRQEPYDAALLVDRLQKQIRPQYLDLFRQISRLPIGVKFLVDLRSDLITVLSHPQLVSEMGPSSKVYLRLLSSQLSDLLSLWFNAGFLRLERVTWDSPTSILQKITEYEAVHPIRNWLDLKHRLGLYRRCYMFSHSCLQGEPLVILHVALVPSISSSIQEIIRRTNIQQGNDNDIQSKTSNLLNGFADDNKHDALSSPKDDPTSPTITTMINGKTFKLQSFSRSPKLHQQFEDPNLVDAAVFYSISSTQKGLNGIDLGNQLIKQVAGGLKAEFPLMTRFSSLSPIPNFTEYLLTAIQAIQRQDDSKGFRKIWMRYSDYERLCGILAVKDEQTFWNRLIQLLRSGNWITDQTLVESFREPLMRICAHYLYHEKRRGYALNPVANFHMKNGAIMWRLNWLADISTRGLSNSCGMMVNYRYFLERHQENSQIYMNEKRIITGDQFEKWLP